MFNSVRFDSVRFGSVRFDSVRFGSVRFGSVRFGSGGEKSSRVSLYKLTYSKKNLVIKYNYKSKKVIVKLHLVLILLKIFQSILSHFWFC
jgi:hypothetical protein